MRHGWGCDGERLVIQNQPVKEKLPALLRAAQSHGLVTSTNIMFEQESLWQAPVRVLLEGGLKALVNMY